MTRRRTRTTSSRASASPTTCAATAATSSAPATAATSTSATPTRTSCSPQSTPPASARNRVRGQQRERASGIPTARSSGQRPDLATIQAQNEAGGALPLNSSRRVAADSSSRTRIRSRSAGRTSSTRRRSSTSTTSTLDGRDIGWRTALNQRNPGVGPTGPRQFATSCPSPARHHDRHQRGESEHDGVNFGLRRRMTHGLSILGVVLAVEPKHDGQRRRRARSVEHPESLDPFTDVQFGPVGPVRCASPGDALARSSGAVGLPGVADLAVTARRCR